MIRGIRGAITVDANEEKEIVEATERLLQEMVKQNDITPERVASVFISATQDLTAQFPAKALRRLEGWTFVPVTCMQEMIVPGSLEKCIRIMMHVDTERSQNEISHIYLEKAKNLRPDLIDKQA
ncbi:chorismate mutase [Aeribacillus alveayuensis]|uniref:chorismate mutase n=1 Tax=Aeribacillus alveayuensis TaxID=279215 RepID=A0ABT9VKQ2_9BACI|nr:chorismate mutase [Bacillus alveayuensis]